MDCGLPEILRLLVYCVIWWKVYLWGLDIVIVLWKLSVVPVLLNIVCGTVVYCLSVDILSVLFVNGTKEKVEE